MRITLFIPCYVDQFYPQIGRHMVTLLKQLGHDVDYPQKQTCCGQPAFNAGHQDSAACVARWFLEVFQDAETIVTPSGSCAAMVKVFYADLFDGQPEAATARQLGKRTWEWSDFLVNELGVTDVGARFAERITYHDGCHGLRELGIKQQPRALLANVRDLELVEMDAAEICCGFGGTFAVKYPQVSTAMALAKCASVERTGARYIVSGDASCLMHLQGYIDQQGLPLRCLHLTEVLAQR